MVQICAVYLQYKSLIWKSAVKSGAIVMFIEGLMKMLRTQMKTRWLPFTVRCIRCFWLGLGAATAEKEGEDPGRAVIRQAERNHIRYTIRTPPSPFLQTSLIMSKLSCGCKYYSLLFEVANRRYCCLPCSLFLPVKEKPSDSKRSTCVPLKSIYFKTWFPSLCHFEGIT